jgi:ribosomal protein S18 acetylase RimI-like enzyme
MFRDRFGTDAARLAERQLYLIAPGGEAVGTGTAWFDDDFLGARFGRVHFVAIVPACQGLGLSKPLMTRVCLRLRELGHDRAYLATSSTRTRAIRLYERFGFEPLIRGEADAAAWKAITG